MSVVTTVDERRVFARGLRSFLSARSGAAHVRGFIESGGRFDRALWGAMAEQLALPGTAIPERFGGGGFGHQELALVFEELGRSLAPVPMLGSAGLAVSALIASGDGAAQEEHLPGIARGETIATVALTRDASGWDAGRVDGLDFACGRLTGRRAFVVDGDSADLILVAAGAPAGATLYAVDGTAPGLTRTRLDGLDHTRGLAHLAFDGVAATPVGEPGRAGPVLERAFDLACIALAAEQVGVAQRALELSVAYACERVQFGRPIGSFQAIKHKCADVHVAIESARSAVGYAAELADSGETAELGTAASLAKAWCSDTVLQATGEAIQIHGGIGFTWEHDAHLLFRRATSSRQLLGDPAWHRERIARSLGW